METRVTSIEATAQFAELLKRVRDRGESFVIEEGGRPVCVLRPAEMKRRTLAEAIELLRQGPMPDDGFAEDVRAYVAEVNKPVVPESPWDR